MSVTDQLSTVLEIWLHYRSNLIHAIQCNVTGHTFIRKNEVYGSVYKHASARDRYHYTVTGGNERHRTENTREVQPFIVVVIKSCTLCTLWVIGGEQH